MTHTLCVAQQVIPDVLKIIMPSSGCFWNARFADESTTFLWNICKYSAKDTAWRPSGTGPSATTL